MAALLPAAAQKVPVVEKQLANGMRLLMVERHDDPSVAGGWVAHVGSSNEKPGLTGIAHLFEHMMFKGTPTLGTKDYRQDLEIIAEQERVRDEMRREEKLMRERYRRGEIDDLLKPENKTERYRQLEQQFNQLIARQREILIKNEFDRVYTAAGASGMNAFTSEDLTAYFINVPANKLELWMWMESERLLHPVFREFYAERDVVYEERRLRTESTPLGRFATIQRPVLEVLPLQLAGHRLALGPPHHHQGPGRRILRHLLLTPEYHPHSRGRLQPRPGPRPGPQILRAHPPRTP